MKDPLQPGATPYEMLGLGPSATGEDVDRAFRARLAGHKEIQKLTAARRALQDPVERALIDLFLLDDAVLKTLQPDATAGPAVLSPPARWATLRAWLHVVPGRAGEPALLQTLGAAWYWSALHCEQAGGARGGAPRLRDQWEYTIACWAALAAQPDYWRRSPAAGDLRTTLIERLRSRLQDCEQPYRDRGDDSGAALYQELEEALDTEMLARGGPGPIMARLLTGRGGSAAAAAPTGSAQTARVRTLLTRGNPQQAAAAFAELPAAARQSAEGRELGTAVYRALAVEFASVDKADEALTAWEQALGFGDTATAAAIHDDIAQYCQSRAAALQRSNRAEALRVLERGLKIANLEKLRLTLAELVAQDAINKMNAAFDAAKAGKVTPETMKAMEHGRRELQRAAALGSRRAAEDLPAAAALIVRMRWHRRSVETTDFNDLPLVVRQRLANCIARREDPAAVLAQLEPAAKGSAGVWAGAGLMLFIVAMVMGIEWGTNSAAGRQSAGVLAAGYIVPLALALTAVAVALQRRAAAQTLPFRAGRYLFPIGYIDARTRALRIVPLARARKLSLNNQQHRYDLTIVVDDGESHTLPIYFENAARAAIDALNNAGRAEEAALQQGDTAALWKLDPLADLYGASSGPNAGKAPVPDGPAEARICAAREVPEYFKWRFAAAAAAAVVIAIPLWFVRDYTSDAARFQSVRGFEPGLVAYLRVGGRFEADARDELDSVRYKAAMANGSEEALQRYLKYGGRYEEAVRKELPAAALRDAKKAGTVAALRGMIIKYPNTAPAAEARSEVTRIYDDALAGFRKQAPGADPRVAPFMDRLLDYLENNAITSMAVRFQPPTIDAALTAALGSSLGQGQEESVVTRFQEAFSKIFRGDVLKLSHAGRVVDAAAARREGPLMLIRYNVAAQGNYVLENRYGLPGERFTGLRIDFAISLSTPDASGVLPFSLSVLPPSSFNVRTYGSLDPSAATVYDTMVARAFDQLHDKLQEVLLGNRSTP